RVEFLVIRKSAADAAHFLRANAGESRGEEKQNRVFFAEVFAQLHVCKAGRGFGFQCKVGCLGAGWKCHSSSNFFRDATIGLHRTRSIPNRFWESQTAKMTRIPQNLNLREPAKSADKTKSSLARRNAAAPGHACIRRFGDRRQIRIGLVVCLTIRIAEP